MATAHVPTWEVTASGGFETAWAEVSPDALRARGRAMGTTPEPYWLSYELETGAGYATERLRVTVRSAAGTRELDLRRQDGGWSAGGEPLPGLDGALDCDLGRSPLTNSMPVLRHSLHSDPGEREFLMAWVSVPDLKVVASRQTYTHLGRSADGWRVRYASGDFRRDLTFDAHGLVLDHPGLAHRLRGR
jgi:uncharacterized protein